MLNTKEVAIAGRSQQDVHCLGGDFVGHIVFVTDEVVAGDTNQDAGIPIYKKQRRFYLRHTFTNLQEFRG